MPVSERFRRDQKRCGYEGAREGFPDETFSCLAIITVVAWLLVDVWLLKFLEAR